jgi:hypothetical protein
MSRYSSKAVQKLALVCQLQAAIIVARQEGAERIALDLEALLEDIQPSFLLAA